MRRALAFALVLFTLVAAPTPAWADEQQGTLAAGETLRIPAFVPPEGINLTTLAGDPLEQRSIVWGTIIPSLRRPRVSYLYATYSATYARWPYWRVLVQADNPGPTQPWAIKTLLDNVGAVAVHYDVLVP